MKLLLTSAGITNKVIQDALEQLLEKDYSELHAMYIPTAKNAEGRDKGWAIRNLSQLYSLNWREFDILDIAAVDSELFWERAKEMDVIIWGGGDPAFLADKVSEKLSEGQIRELFKNKVHMGISAGSMFISPMAYFYGETEKQQETKGLGIIDFYVKPHQANTSVAVDSFAKKNITVHCLDDSSALILDGTSIEVVSGNEAS